MKNIIAKLVCVAALAVSGCSEGRDASPRSEVESRSANFAGSQAPQTEFGFMKAEEDGLLNMFSGGEDRTVERVTTVDIEEAGAAANEIPVSIPQIAYIYEFGFRIGAAEMSGLQERHVALCESMGAQQCQVLEMRSSGGEGDYAHGILRLAVTAEKARGFGEQLTETATSSGGEQVSSSITGEDLSKQIVDTEARLRARTLLRDRLMEVLATRRGTVAELVEAERGVAQVNEEIDQARSWLEEMRGRVALSRVNVSYESGSPSSGGFIDPIRYALGSMGSILGNVVAVILMAAVGVLPVGLLVWGGLWLRRKWLKKEPEAMEDQV